MEFVIKARGHPLVKGTHPTTFEITKDNYLTPRGDCIIGICASHACSDLPNDLKEYLKKGGKIVIVLEVENLRDEIIAYGHPNLILSNEKSIVVRKSNYIDDRTLAIRANKASSDIDRRIINELKKGKELRFIIKYDL